VGTETYFLVKGKGKIGEARENKILTTILGRAAKGKKENWLQTEQRAVI